MRSGRYTLTEKETFSQTLARCIGPEDEPRFLETMNITSDTFCCWCTADPMPTRRQTEQIAEFLHMDLDELLGPEPKPRQIKKPKDQWKKTGPKPKNKSVEFVETTGTKDYIISTLKGQVEVYRKEVNDLQNELNTRKVQLSTAELLLKVVEDAVD